MAETTPIVNVVTVTYNAESVVESTIRSVIQQCYPNIKYTIVDGNSSDTTLAICQKYKDHINTLISEPDNGIYDGMNKALNTIQNGWCIFLNAGDTFYSKNTLADIFRDNRPAQSCVVLYGRWYRGETLQTPLNPKLLPKGIMFACHQAMIFKHTNIRYDQNMSIHADLEFVCQYAKEGDMMEIDNIVCNYEEGGISTHDQQQKKRRQDKYRTILRHYGCRGVMDTALYRLFAVNLKDWSTRE